MGVHPDKTAARAVDACGGTSPASGTDYGDGWSQGYEAALDAATAAVKSVDVLMSELFEALAPEAMERAADQFQECGKHRLAAEYRAIADRQRAVTAKSADAR